MSARPALRLLREPLLAFLVLGGACFAAWSLLTSQKEPISYTPAVEQALVNDFELLAGRPANNADRARLRREYLTDELMFREALDRGLHLTDSQVKRRMIDKLRYLIVGSPEEPTEEQLVDFYAEHLDRYYAEPKTSFSQVFFSERPADADALLARLRAGEAVAGEDFWMGRDYPDYGDSMVRGIFGQSFVERLKVMPDQQWEGLVQSPRGWHFVRREKRSGATLLAFPVVRDQVRQDVMMAETGAAIQAAVGTLEKKYDVDVGS